GGDECFAGYERYAAMRLAEYFRRCPKQIREFIVEPATTLRNNVSARSHLGKGLRFLAAAGLPRDIRYHTWTSAIDEPLKGDLCTSDFLHSCVGHPTVSYFSEWFRGNGSIDIVDRVLAADTANYLPNDLLVKVDIASMAVSLEA